MPCLKEVSPFPSIRRLEVWNKCTMFCSCVFVLNLFSCNPQLSRSLIGFGVRNQFHRKVVDQVRISIVVATGEEGPIDRIKTPDEISDKPLRLPTGFSWVDIDLFNEKDVRALLVIDYVIG